MFRFPVFAGIIVFSVSALFAQADPSILVINSYHRGYLWTDQQSDAIQSTLVKELPKARIEVQYMDWKRYPTQENLSNFLLFIQHHYQASPPDVILTTDDAALLFALQHRKDIFGPVPIVYAGIFESTGERLMAANPDLTGVFEAVDLEGTIRIARSLLPQASQAVIIHDSSETSLTMEKDLKAVMARTSPGTRIKVLTALPFEDLLAEIRTLGPESYILLASYARDSKGLVKQPEEFALLMDEVSKVPLFTFYEHMLGSGVTGGSLLSGSLQGQAAGHLAARILMDPERKVPKAVYDKTVYYGFDYTRLSKYQLQDQPLPPDSKILHKPFDFFQEYRALVIAVTLVFLILVILLFTLVINIRQRSRTEARLRETNSALELSQEKYRQINDELEQRVEQRTTDLSRSNHELEESITRLNVAREQLVQREKLAALGNLVAGVAHELNTPIGSALTMASGLNDRLQEFRDQGDFPQVPAGRTDELINWALTGTGLLSRTLQRASDLISSFKQIAVNRSSDQRRRFTLQEVVAQEVSVMQVEAARYQVKIIQDIDPHLTMDSYPGMLGQILDNLVQNALTHGFRSRNGGEIRITGISTGKDMVRLDISDNGVGIPVEHHARVFEPFFTTTLGQGGSGLGLHIVYNLVLALGGTISLANQESGGLRLRIDLPVTSPEGASQS